LRVHFDPAVDGERFPEQAAVLGRALEAEAALLDRASEILERGGSSGAE